MSDATYNGSDLPRWSVIEGTVQYLIWSLWPWAVIKCDRPRVWNNNATYTNDSQQEIEGKCEGEIGSPYNT